MSLVQRLTSLFSLHPLAPRSLYTTQTSSTCSPACCQRFCQARWQALSHHLHGPTDILYSSQLKHQLRDQRTASPTFCPQISLMAATLLCTTTRRPLATPLKMVHTPHDRQNYMHTPRTASETMFVKVSICLMRTASSSTSRSRGRTHHFSLAPRTDMSIQHRICLHLSTSIVAANLHPILTLLPTPPTSALMEERHQVRTAPSWLRAWLWTHRRVLRAMLLRRCQCQLE